MPAVLLLPPARTHPHRSRCRAAAPSLLACLPACLPPPLAPTNADGWGFSQLGNNPMGPSPNALKYQVIGTLHAAAYMRGEGCGGWRGATGLPCCCHCEWHYARLLCEPLTEAAHGCPVPTAVPLIVMNTLVVFVKLVFG